MSEKTQDEFRYRYPHKVFGHTPGSHVGTSLGSGDRFAGFTNLFDYPDPRRLDIRASLRSNIADAGNRWLVRRYQQRSSVTLWLLADLSKSMALPSDTRDELANLAQLIAHSAISIGDRFAIAGFDSQLRQDVAIMPTTQRSMPVLVAEMIRNAKVAQAPGAEGLIHTANLVTSSHAMVFLASDFCIDIRLVEKALHQLSHYTVIPIVRQHHDADYFPSHAGWTEIRDAETGQRRSVWMRPSMKRRWQQSMADHFEQLDACFTHYRVKPLFVDGAVTAEQLDRYFLGLRRA